MTSELPDNQYIGNPCRKHGHTIRYKQSGNCVECGKLSQKNFQSAPGAKKRAADYARRRYQANPEIRQKQRDYRIDRYNNDPSVRQARIEAANRWNSTPVNKQRKRESALKKNFGINNDQYLAMLMVQNGVCACCGKADTRHLSVDHNHKTGEIRELLCSRCNVAVGILENPLASKWLRYLEKHNGHKLTA